MGDKKKKPEVVTLPDAHGTYVPFNLDLIQDEELKNNLRERAKQQEFDFQKAKAGGVGLDVSQQQPLGMDLRHVISVQLPGSDQKVVVDLSQVKDPLLARQLKSMQAPEKIQPEPEINQAQGFGQVPMPNGKILPPMNPNGTFTPVSDKVLPVAGTKDVFVPEEENKPVARMADGGEIDTSKEVKEPSLEEMKKLGFRTKEVKEDSPDAGQPLQQLDPSEAESMTQASPSELQNWIDAFKATVRPGQGAGAMPELLMASIPATMPFESMEQITNPNSLTHQVGKALAPVGSAIKSAAQTAFPHTFAGPKAGTTSPYPENLQARTPPEPIKTPDQATTGTGFAMPKVPGIPNMAKQVAADEKRQEAAIDERARVRGEGTRELINQNTETLNHLQSIKSAHDAEMAKATQEYESLLSQWSDAKINPEQYWANKTTGSKILAGIGLALGALGAGKDGINRSVSVIEDAINRDVDAQKANLEKTGKLVGAKGNLLNIMRQNYETDLSAESMTRATMWQSAIEQFKAKMADAEDPVMKGQLQAGLTIAQQKQAMEIANLQSEMQLRAAHIAALAAKTNPAAKGAGDTSTMESAINTGVERYVDAIAANPTIKSEEAMRELDNLGNMLFQSVGGRGGPQALGLFKDQITGNEGMLGPIRSFISAQKVAHSESAKAALKNRLKRYLLGQLSLKKGKPNVQGFESEIE